MTTTSDRNDPGLQKVDERGMQEKYLVLSEEERAKGFVEPVRHSYIHSKCGAVTHMGDALAETYARNPEFYGATYCCKCQDHFPVGAEGEFLWCSAQGVSSQKVGTRSE